LEINCCCCCCCCCCRCCFCCCFCLSHFSFLFSLHSLRCHGRSNSCMVTLRRGLREELNTRPLGSATIPMDSKVHLCC
jgi:hypothetical protein